MADLNHHTTIFSNLWDNTYPSWIIVPGDLVSIGPVHKQRIGIALAMKHVSFGYEPDEWDVLVDGKVEIHSSVYVYPICDEKRLLDSECSYNFYSYEGEKS